MQQGQVLGHNVRNLVGNKDLIAVQLNLVAVHIEVVLDLREIEYTRQVEGIIDIQVDVEQRLIELHRVEFAVEGFVVFLLQIGRLARPCRRGVVDDVFLAGLYLLAVLPFLLHAKGNLYGQELAILFEQSFDSCLLKVLRELIADMQNDVRATLGFDGLLHLVLRRAFARPVHGFGIVVVTLRENLNLVADHKGTIET